MDYTIINGELHHAGVKGMKWGVRRYQNKDGSLTAAGRKRYGASKEEAMKARAKAAKAKAKAEKASIKAAKKAEKANAKAAKQDDKESKKLMKKSVKDMTDEELKRAIARANLEEEYLRKHPPEVSKGRAFIETAWDDAVKPALIDAGKNYLKKVADHYIGEMYTDPNSYAALKAKYDKLEIKQKIDLMKDKEYQQLKKESEMAGWRKNINKGQSKKSSDSGSSKDSDNTKSETKSKTSDDTEVHSGTVMGEGTSRAKANSGKKWSESDTVVDADWWSAEPAKAANTSQARLGQSYVQRYLLEEVNFH